MRPNDLRDHLRKQPFEPFRLFLSNGVWYDVRHPEMMFVGRTEVVIATELGEGDLPAEFAYCDPIHITHIEPLDGAKGGRRKTKRK